MWRSHGRHSRWRDNTAKAENGANQDRKSEERVLGEGPGVGSGGAGVLFKGQRLHRWKAVKG